MTTFFQNPISGTSGSTQCHINCISKPGWHQQPAIHAPFRDGRHGQQSSEQSSLSIFQLLAAQDRQHHQLKMHQSKQYAKHMQRTHKPMCCLGWTPVSLWLSCQVAAARLQMQSWYLDVFDCIWSPLRPVGMGRHVKALGDRSPEG